MLAACREKAQEGCGGAAPARVLGPRAQETTGPGGQEGTRHRLLVPGARGWRGRGARPGRRDGGRGCQSPVRAHYGSDMILINYRERCHSWRGRERRRAFRRRKKRCDSPALPFFFLYSGALPSAWEWI